MTPTHKTMKRHAAQDCALIYTTGDTFSIIGGRGIGWPERHDTHFILQPEPIFHRPFVGIKLLFPKSTDTGAGFCNENREEESTSAITFLLHLGTWTSSVEGVTGEMLARLPPRQKRDDRPLTLVRFKMHEGERASVQGLGLPFKGKSVADDEVVNLGRPVEGVRTIAEICVQNEFCVLMRYPDIHLKAKDQFSNEFPTSPFLGFPYSAGYAAFSFCLSFPALTC